MRDDGPQRGNPDADARAGKRDDAVCCADLLFAVDSAAGGDAGCGGFYIAGFGDGAAGRGLGRNCSAAAGDGDPAASLPESGGDAAKQRCAKCRSRTGYTY